MYKVINDAGEINALRNSGNINIVKAEANELFKSEGDTFLWSKVFRTSRPRIPLLPAESVSRSEEKSV
jgi:hypothetical protein